MTSTYSTLLQVVDNDYFVHFFPLDQDKVRHMIFILDKGLERKKLDVTIEGLRTFLNILGPSNYFSIIEYNNDYGVR